MTAWRPPSLPRRARIGRASSAPSMPASRSDRLSAPSPWQQLRPMLLSPAQATSARIVETRKTGETQSGLARSTRSLKGWWAAAAALALVGGVYGGLQYTRWNTEQRGRAEAEAKRDADQDAQRRADAIKKAQEEVLEKARAEAEAKRKAEEEAKREPWNRLLIVCSRLTRSSASRLVRSSRSARTAPA